MNQGYYSTEKGKSKHLCLWERQEIEKALKRGASISAIARTLGRNKSTISREVKRGTVLQRKRQYYEPVKKEHRENWKGHTEKRIYFAETGQRAAARNTGLRGGKYKLFKDIGLVKYIEERILKDKWSPEMIIGLLRTQKHTFKTTVCFKTVYNYIDRGLIGVKNIDLLLKPRLKVKKRRAEQRKRVLGKSIELRPCGINERTEFGHWEGDTVVGQGGRSAILTIVERKTNKGFMLSLKDRNASSVNAAFETLSKTLNGLNIFKSITFDNGSEFADCHKLKDIDIYFAHPYSAFERGINENYNGIIRRYIPKGKDLNIFTQADLNRINNMIDSLPRKRHNYQTAQTMFDLELDRLCRYPAG